MLEFALDNYPVRRPLENNESCLIRPQQPGDHAALLHFLHQVPELERLFIKQRLDDPALAKDWCHDIDFDARLPLLAFTDGALIGLATLEQRHGGWKRHIGMVRALTHPAYRGLGLASHLIGEMVSVARHCGLSHLQAEFNGEREVAIRAFAECGFVELARLPDYVMDMQAKTHAYVLMGMNLTTDPENAGAGD